jgi:hypothetical protein
MAVTYEPIATTTLGSATSTITFNSVSGSYTDLRLVVVPISGGSTNNMSITFNNDTGTNYSATRIYADGTSVSSARNTNQSSIILDAGSTYISATPSLRTIDIFSYGGSTNKTVLATTNCDKNGSGALLNLCGLWRSTSAITRVDIISDGNFASGTIATIYGIKAA